MDKTSEIQAKSEVASQNLDIVENNINSSVRPKLSWKLLKTRRFIVTILGMFGFMNVYALRASLSVGIVAMTAKTTHVLENGTKIQIQEFTWTSEQQGIVLSSFFWGYVCTQIVGGILATRFGGNRVFGIGIGVSSVLMMLSPLAAKQGLYYLVAMRILIGLFEGVSYSSIQDVYANWAPRYERTAMISVVYMGTQLGIFTSFLLSGFFADHFGWESIFYIFGGFGVVWYALWTYFVKRNPASDPRITVEEKNYIESNLDTSGSHRIPWISMITSKAMIAFVIVVACDGLSGYVYITESPTYVNDVLKSDLGTTGVIAAVPYLIYLFFAVGVGVSSDYLRSRNILTTQQVRKTMIGTGFLAGAGLTILMANLNNFAGICTCLVFTICFSALVTISSICNPLDFAPDYCSVATGISNTFGSISGIVAPMLTGYIVKTGSKDEWKTVFYIAAASCIFGMVVFTAFGQGSIQSWAKTKPTQQRQLTSEDPVTQT
ncbi:MFS domain-containing protein [Sergentomyia squamirostris]